MKYVVRIDYKEFEFNDGTTALTFAELAVNRSTERVKVSIEIKKEKSF